MKNSITMKNIFSTHAFISIRGIILYRFVELFYIDSWNYGAFARFMNHHCIGNAVLELNTAGYFSVPASKNIEQNNFVDLNYIDSTYNKCCECKMLPFNVE
jgi:hypothetical protein